MARSNAADRKRRSIQRLVVAQNPLSPDGHEAELRRIRGALADAAAKINKTLRVLVKDARQTGIDAPSVSVEIYRDGDRVPTATLMIENTIEDFEDRDLSNLVALVYFNDLRDDLPSGYAEAANGRLLLGIRAHLPDTPRTDDLGWRCSNGGLSGVIAVNAAAIPSIIEDLLIDFTLSNSQPLAQHTQRMPASVLAEKKLAFVRKMNLRCFYGDYSSDAQYACFASCARNALGHNIGDNLRTLSIWQAFADQELTGATGTSTNRDSVVESVYQRHKHRGSLSRAELAKRMAQLPEGNYHLLMTVNRPKRSGERQRIARICGDEFWHQYSWTIVPATSFKEFAKDVQDGYFSSLAFAI